MDFQTLLSRVALALGIGLLIGIERGWRTREAEPGSRTAGIRTFAITGLLGGITGALAQGVGVGSLAAGIILAAGFAVYALIMALFSRDENRALKIHSATTAIAGMLTFALGAYAMIGDVRIAAAAAVAATGLLATREELHDWVGRVTWPELRSGLILLAMTFVVLPVLPDRNIGPFGGANPREIWIIAILLAGVSFAGYVAVKYFDDKRGILLAAIAGGLVSSTAVTVASARRAAAGEGAARVLAAGVAIATAISYLRVLAIIAGLQPQLLAYVAAPLLAAAGVAVLFALVSLFWRKAAPGEQQKIEFRNPFAFWPVIGMAALLGAITMLGRALADAFGAPGAITGAAIVGFADVDSVAVSLAHLVPAPLSLASAAYAILAAAATGTLSKVLIAAGLGRNWFAVEIAAMTLACFIAGGVALAVILAVVPQ